MVLPQVNSCCGCATLRTGSIIIGWITVVKAVLDFLEKIINPDEFGGWVMVVTCILYFLLLVIGILALMGAYSRKAEYLSPYVYLSIFVVIFAIMELLVMIFVSDDFIKSHAKKSEGSDVKTIRYTNIFSVLILIVVQSYLLLVVNSYRKVLTGEWWDNSSTV